MSGPEMRAEYRASDRRMAREVIDHIRDKRAQNPAGFWDESWCRDTLRSLRAAHSLSIRAEQLGVFA
jgi:hypothetical protein